MRNGLQDFWLESRVAFEIFTHLHTTSSLATLHFDVFEKSVKDIALGWWCGSAICQYTTFLFFSSATLELYSCRPEPRLQYQPTTVASQFFGGLFTNN